MALKKRFGMENWNSQWSSHHCNQLIMKTYFWFGSSPLKRRLMLSPLTTLVASAKLPDYAWQHHAMLNPSMWCSCLWRASEGLPHHWRYSYAAIDGSRFGWPECHLWGLSREIEANTVEPITDSNVCHELCLVTLSLTNETPPSYIPMSCDFYHIQYPICWNIRDR